MALCLGYRCLLLSTALYAFYVGCCEVWLESGDGWGSPWPRVVRPSGGSSLQLAVWTREHWAKPAGVK